MKLKEVTESFGFPIDRLGDLPVDSVSMSADYQEKMKTDNSILPPWIEKYKASQSITLTITLEKRFPPEFYEEKV